MIWSDRAFVRGVAQAVIPCPPRIAPSRHDPPGRGPIGSPDDASRPRPHGRRTSTCEGLAVGCGCERNPKIWVEMIDMRSVDEHAWRVDRWRRATPAMKAVVEGSSSSRSTPDGSSASARSRSSRRTARPVPDRRPAPDPEQVHRRAGPRGRSPLLGRRIPAGVVGVRTGRTQPLEERETPGGVVSGVTDSTLVPTRLLSADPLGLDRHRHGQNLEYAATGGHRGPARCEPGQEGSAASACCRRP